MTTLALTARYGRLLDGMQFIQLMTRTFSTLKLVDHAEVTDTLSALTGSFFDCQARAALLVDADTGALVVGASEGFGGAQTLLDDDAARLWRWAMAERLPCALTAEELRARWPGVPARASTGLACVAITLHDRAVGLLIVAGRRSREAFEGEELAFLASASGLASMAVANADAQAEQRRQRELAERSSEAARAEAREKQAVIAQLDRKLEIIASQREQIAELSTPVLQVHPEILAVPLIGVIDEYRRDELSSRLMIEVARRRARCIILDITGVGSVEARTADHFVRLARTAKLLGAHCVVTGIRPRVAQTLVGLELALDSLTTAATFGDGLERCLAQLAGARERAASR